jgi:hypothetical protein
MRTLLIGIAASGLLAGTAFAQQSHELVPGTDQIVAPAPPLASDDRVATPPVGEAGRQTGIAGNADGSNDFPRARPDPGSIGPAYPNASALSPVSATARNYPLSWNGSAQDWTMHSQACAIKYKGYDATTDTYDLRRGVRAMCPARMGMKK